MKGLRDRALLGFAGAFRRSELVALDVAGLQFCDGGLRVVIRKSKTDQEGQGATIAIARGSIACPVEAVRAWIKTAGVVDGPLFRPVTRTGKISARRLSARAVAELVNPMRGGRGCQPPAPGDLGKERRSCAISTREQARPARNDTRAVRHIPKD